MLFSSFLAVADESQKTPTAQQKPLIITTIKPLAIIAKSAVADNARVEYLQSAVQSAHEVSLPVSALKKIEQAELIIWIGEGFEARIGKPMALLSEAKRITVMELTCCQLTIAILKKKPIKKRIKFNTIMSICSSIHMSG